MSFTIQTVNIPYGPFLEEWRDIAEFEGQYMISNYGRVLSKSRIKVKPTKWGDVPYRVKAKIMAQSKDRMGYPTVSLAIGKRTITKKIHRLIGMAFIHNPDNKPEINHLNCIKANSVLWNLEWCTHAENMKHAAENGAIPTRLGNKSSYNKLMEEDIPEIRKMIGVKSYREIGEIYGVDQSTIYHIKTGRNWSHIK